MSVVEINQKIEATKVWQKIMRILSDLILRIKSYLARPQFLVQV